MTHRRFARRSLVQALAVMMVVVCAACVPSPPDRAGARIARGVGFSPGADLLWMAPADQRREMNAMAAAGVRWLRLDFPWPSLEPKPGEWNWAPFDRAVASARKRGLNVLGVLSYAPRWARRAASAGVAPFDAAAFASFTGTSARHFRTRGVRHWEVWNEENLAASWGAAPDARAYTKVLRAASSAIRRADPAATVVSGGLAPATNAPDRSQVAPLTFASTMYAAGARSSFDAFAVHPYTFPAMPDDATTARWSTFLRLSDIRRLMVRHGDGSKQIWLTEIGAPTGTAHGAVSETAQARYVTRSFDAWVDRPWTGPIFWYSMRDRSSDRSEREDNFGLLRRDFTPKPAYRAFVAAVGRLGN